MPVFTRDMLSNIRVDPSKSMLDEYIGWHYCSGYSYSMDKSEWCHTNIGDYHKEWAAFNQMFLFKNESNAMMFLLKFNATESDNGFFYAPYIPIHINVI